MYDTPTHTLPPLGEPPPEPPPEEPPPSRRRLLLYATIAAAVVIVIVVPVALVLLLRGDAGPATTDLPSAPVATPTAAATGTTTATAPTSAAANPATPAPDGRIPAEVLKNATLEIPAWPTDNVTGPAGRIRFSNGEFNAPPSAEFPTPSRIAIYNVTYGDVDRDGAQETVAALYCGWEGGSVQLVAFDRNAAGDIVTMGRIVATTGEVRTIQFGSARVLGDGAIQVPVGDYQGCCGDETPKLWQTRGYRWNGHAFAQTTGPTAFPVNPAVTETTLTADELVLGPPADGVRRGTVTVRIGYPRGAKPAAIALTFNGVTGLQRDGTAWPPVRAEGHGAFTVDVAAPALGGTATYTFAFSAAATGAPTSLGIESVALRSDGSGLSQSNPYNNSAGVSVRTAG